MVIFPVFPQNINFQSTVSQQLAVDFIYHIQNFIQYRGSSKRGQWQKPVELLKTTRVKNIFRRIVLGA